MASVHTSVLATFGAPQLSAPVRDVERYPAFRPCCAGVRTIERPTWR